MFRRKNPNEFGLSDEQLKQLKSAQKSPTATASTPPSSPSGSGRISPVNRKPFHLGHFGMQPGRQAAAEPLSANESAAIVVDGTEGNSKGFGKG